MPVFANYSARAAAATNVVGRGHSNIVGGQGSFLKQMKPNVHVYPWRPAQSARPGQVRTQLQQPHERGLSFSFTTVNGSNGQTMQDARSIKAGTMSSNGCGCGCKGSKGK